MTLELDEDLQQHRAVTIAARPIVKQLSGGQRQDIGSESLRSRTEDLAVSSGRVQETWGSYNRSQRKLLREPPAASTPPLSGLETAHPEKSYPMRTPITGHSL